MNYSIYIHEPFCKRRCHYCDFYTTTGTEGLIPAYIDALIKEFRIVTDEREKFSIHSIYFGGGTPSLISAGGYEKLLGELFSVFNVMPDCEISLEANPGTLSVDYLENLKQLGFNRISIGVQSTDSFDLTRLDRIHDIDDVLSSVSYARSAGFENISLDLIFSLPWQNISGWVNSLDRAIELNPQHFSVYSLIIEPGTPLYHWYQRGLIAKKDQDLEGEMYELTISMLHEAGYGHYEISNWNKQSPSHDYRCRHNLQYWLNQPYFGFGAGSHGYVESVRTVNTPNLQKYINQINSRKHSELVFPGTPATISMNAVDQLTQMRDHMMLGLRLIQEGVSEQRFYDLYGKPMLAEFDKEILFLLDRKLVEWENNGQKRLKLTPRGVMVANQVFMQFV